MKNSTILTRIAKARQGAAMTEYVILLGLIGVVTIFSVGELGLKISGVYTTITEEVALDRETPEQVITPGGGGGGGNTVTPPVLPGSGACVAISTTGGYLASTNAGASCYIEDFSWTSVGENHPPADFIFDVPAGPVYLAPAADTSGFLVVNGSSGDDVVVISNPGVGVVLWESGGSDGFVFESVSSSDMAWSVSEEFGTTFLKGSAAGNTINVTIRSCDIDYVQFTDGLVLADAIFDSATPDGSNPGDCNNLASGGGDPFGGGPFGG